MKRFWFAALAALALASCARSCARDGAVRYLRDTGEVGAVTCEEHGNTCVVTSATEIIALDCSDVDGCTNGGGCREITRGPRQVVR